MSRGSLTIAEVLTVSRPPWWLVTCTTFMAGGILVDHSLTAGLFIGALYFLMPYNLLMYGVDDMYNSRSGHASGRVLSKLKHPALWRTIGVVNLPFLFYFMLAGNVESTVFLFMMVYMVLAYSLPGLRYKEIPVIDALTSGFHHTSPFLFGLFFFGSPNLWAPIFAALYFLAVGNHAFGTIKDMLADREAGIKSTATALGAGTTVIFTLMLYIVAALAPILAYGEKGLIAALAIAPYFILVASTYKDRFNGRSKNFKRVSKYFLLVHYCVAGAAAITWILLYNK